MGVNIKGGNNSAGLANVSATYELQVVTPQTEANAGFVQVSSEVDPGNVLGTRTVLPLEISDDYRVRVGSDQVVFNLGFEGTNFPNAHLTTNATTMTSAQANGFMVINSGPITTVNTANYTRTTRHFPTFGTYPSYLDMWIREGNHTATNAISEWGYLYLTTATTQAPLEGVFFRRLSGGGLRAVINFNGTETEYTIDTTNVPPRDGVATYDATEVNHYLIAYHNDTIRFWINDVLVASIECPGSQPNFTNSSNLPVGFRVWNGSSTPSAARQLSIGFVSVAYGDQSTNKAWGHVMTGSGQGAYQTQQGNAGAQTALWANSTVQGTASLSNTVPSYSTLGGLWLAAAVAAAETDYALFGYLNPVGTTTLPGKTLYVTGIRIGETVSYGAAVATPTTFVWGVGVGSSTLGSGTATTAQTLAQADTVAGVTTTTSPRRIPLGSQSFLASAGIGSISPGFQVDFSHAPLVVPAGTYLHIILRQPAGAVTASLVFRGSVTVIGYYE